MFTKNLEFMINVGQFLLTKSGSRTFLCFLETLITPFVNSILIQFYKAFKAKYKIIVTMIGLASETVGIVGNNPSEHGKHISIYII